MSRLVDEPAVPSPVVADPVDGEPHSHPLPGWLRVGMVLYGLVLGVTLTAIAGGGWIIFSGAEERRDQQIEAAKNGVLAELERRTANRDAEAVRQDADAAETRRLVDDLTLELARLRALAERAGLDTSEVPVTAPRRPSAPQPSSPPPSGVEQPPTAPSPPATSPPAPPPPSPTASPTCAARLPIVGTCLLP